MRRLPLYRLFCSLHLIEAINFKRLMEAVGTRTKIFEIISDIGEEVQ